MAILPYNTATGVRVPTSRAPPVGYAARQTAPPPPQSFRQPTSRAPPPPRPQPTPQNHSGVISFSGLFGNGIFGKPFRQNSGTHDQVVGGTYSIFKK